jgi:hypothetical protein
MPWPSPIDRLLARTDSRAAQALRWGLRGLGASLQAALNDIPDDPGSEELRELLSALDSLLGSASVFAGPTLPVDELEVSPASRAGPGVPGAARLAAPTAEPGLLPLARAVADDARFREALNRAPLRQGSDDEIWNDVQRLLLRVSPELAVEWQQRCLAYAQDAGGRPDDARTTLLPLGRDEVIYPGLTGAIEATGLRSSVTAPSDARVAESSDEELRPLASIVSSYLWFIEHDPHLHHCLQSVFRFGVAPLAGDQRQRYQAELLRRWERVRSGTQGLKERLKAHLDLDEALHSLVYQPLADTRSWWGRLQAQARDTLLQARDRAARTGCHVHLQLLSGNFADVNHLAPNSLQVDFGVPGEVAACLRVWARIDGEELKGRVLYRSPGEEP